MIDSLITHWNPIATIIATGISFSLLIFNVYAYLDKKAKLSEVSITNATIDQDGNTTFTLKCRNSGLEDLYVEDVSAIFNKESINYINQMEMGNDSSGIYNNPLKLTENESIDSRHLSCSGLKKYMAGNSITGKVVIKTSANDINRNVKFKFENN